MRIFILFIPFMFFSVSAFSQCKTYAIGERGDTLNCTDAQNRKQGKWVVQVEALRGNPGYEEEGIFTDNKKEGVWRRYSLMGDLLAMENYKWGLKDGQQQYFTVAGLEKEENWKAVDPNKLYDTLQVMRLDDQNLTEEIIVKNEGRSMKHGHFKYYKPATGILIRQEIWRFDKPYVPTIDLPGTGRAASDTTATAAPAPKKPSAVQEWEKKAKGKKSIRVRGGNTGM